MVDATAMGIIVVLTLHNILVTGWWFWVGKTPLGIYLRVALVLLLGVMLTRLIRAWPGIRETRARSWAFLLVFPWYLIAMWVVRLVAILTMNRQGWVTRNGTNGGVPGGFNGRNGNGRSSKAQGLRAALMTSFNFHLLFLSAIVGGIDFYLVTVVAEKIGQITV